MRKIKYIIVGILIVSLNACSFFITGFSYNSYSYAVSIDGYWNDWFTSYDYSNRINFYDNHFILYDDARHPSEYTVKVSYKISTERKEGNWYVYNGNVEYYTEKASDKFYFEKWPNYWPYGVYNGGNGVKKTSPATIKISRKAKTAHNGATFNIFFENNAIGITRRN